LPLAVVYAIDAPVAPPILRALVAVFAAATVLARIWYREPFRELRCAPACVFNPDLVAHAPHIVRGAEWALAVVVALWAVVALASVVGRRSPDVHRHAAPPVLALAVLALVWAGRLAQQPRPLPDDSDDRWLFTASLGAIAIGAGIHGLSAIGVVVARWRITRDARSLSNAATLESITGHLQHATGDPDLHVRLGADSPSGAATTSVLRGARVVASIDHPRAARQRVAVAVTPAIALALETQLLLAEARAHVAELERSRAVAVDTTDAARRRLERDLHDGAQQRLLVVGMRLAHAADEQPTSDTWRIAVTHVADALAELRRIGRGDAAIIAELGLEDAMTALAGMSRLAVRERTIRCARRDHNCWPQTTATAIYRLVVGSIADAERMTAEELAVELRCLGEGHGHTV
jgi:signal transduction histidine kinase